MDKNNIELKKIFADKNLEKEDVIGYESRNNYLRTNENGQKTMLLLEVELLHNNQ